MTKYAVNLNVPCPVLGAGNLRGEWRWEANVLASLLQAGKDVCTTKERSFVPLVDSVENMIYIQHLVSAGEDTIFSLPSINTDNAAKYICQVFAYPTKAAKLYLDELIAKHGENVFITHSFPSSPEYKQYAAMYPNNFHWLATPAVDTIHEADNFYSTHLLWNQRYILELLKREETRPLLEWLANKMKKDGMTLDILTGYTTTWLLNGQLKSTDIEAHLKSLPIITELFGDVLDQIMVYSDIDWSEVVELTGKAKLIVSPPRRYGGTPLEAASHGIPTVNMGTENVFAGITGLPVCKQLLYGHDSADIPTFITELDHLYTDHKHYWKTVHTQREHTRKYWTFDAFTEQLDILLRAPVGLCAERSPTHQ